MIRKQGDFGVGMSIVEPDAGAASHRQPRPVRRIGHIPTEPAFAQTGAGPFGQIKRVLVLGTAVLHE